MLRPITCLKDDPVPKVSFFIDFSSTKWKVHLLKEYFIEMDVEIICNIPLSTRCQVDDWAWHYEKKVFFFQFGLLTGCW